MPQSPGRAPRGRRRHRQPDFVAWLLPKHDVIDWARRMLRSSNSKERLATRGQRPAEESAGRPPGPRSRAHRAVGSIGPLAHLFELHPRLERSLLPAVALVLVAVLALAAWQMAPNGPSEAEHLVASGDEPSAGGVGSAGQEPAERTETLAHPSPSPGGQRPAGGVARVAPADTDGPFPSGVAAGSLSDAKEWEEYRGRKVDVVVTFTQRTSWRGIVYPWIGIDRQHFSDFPGDWVISQPLFPESGPEKGNLADCAAGKYNEHWRAFGRWLVSKGRGDSFVRLGWEFNGHWFAWSATNPPQWIKCFQNASSSVKATSPRVRIDWTMNAHNSATPVGAFALYPGDAYVDVVGIDTYDQYPSSPDPESFDEQCYAKEGLCQAIAFARMHNKLFSVPEWGVVAKTGTRAGEVSEAGGDNPVYIEKMHQVFMRNADILAYEAYFNDDERGNVHSALVNPVRHPRASAAYQRLW